jgi:hypothetical protein
MTQSVLPPIRDILPGRFLASSTRSSSSESSLIIITGYLHEYPSTTPSPQISSLRGPQPHSSSPRFHPLELSRRRSPSEADHSPQSVNRSPRSISSYIPTSSFQSRGSTKPPITSPTSVHSEIKQPKRGRTPSSESSVPSDRSVRSQQSDSDGEGHGHRAPKKRRREEKKHACPYCNKLFHRPVSLGVHINTHTGDKREFLRLLTASPLSDHHVLAAYTCPFPNCSRQFNVNSNMRRHYRTHFTPGTVELSELSYSSADEKFYRHATNSTASNTTRIRPGPNTHYLPPLPSVSYIASASVPQYPRSDSPPTAIRENSYAVSVSYVPVIYHHGPIPPADVNCSGNHQEIRGREASEGSVGRLKPASDWNCASRRAEVADMDESDYDDGSDEVDHDGDEPAW